MSQVGTSFIRCYAVSESQCFDLSRKPGRCSICRTTCRPAPSHFRSNVTFSIFPVNANGGLYVKSTAERRLHDVQTSPTEI